MKVHRIGAVLAAGALVLTACRGDDGPQTLEDALPQEEATGAAEADDEPEPTPEPDDEPEQPEDEPLYAPLPDLEPDPDNDIPDDVEREILEVHAAAYDLMFTAYATGEAPDEDELRRYLSPDQTQLFLEDLEALRQRGVREYSPDTDVRWVRVTAFHSGSAVTRECRIVGERTGLYDAETGEFAEEAPRDVTVVEQLLQLEVDEGEATRWVISDFDFVVDEECAS